MRAAKLEANGTRIMDGLQAAPLLCEGLDCVDLEPPRQGDMALAIPWPLNLELV
jgi:hypothetical protein